MSKLKCEYCRHEPEPGWIYMGNGGETVPCPACNPKTDREWDFERALTQKALQTATQKAQRR